ncbi:hypothetical protein M427DRAFT_236857 [Gonapodya prolifera JEL478]|uniref:RING-type domain-containing protein n=1 Tax=Gonapodya prolifera (strain JEL478) TaxID=1344416 RepID=A0A139AMJ5_GONPJ|nr:hypothetical protein M427DRAFT_236857 [Gonapodya prolifera JEL478]|eukprot:KXS17990.1 hypothetical protein M427DRAFT_236857 [Gonapodya prolifera JEL478]
MAQVPEGAEWRSPLTDMFRQNWPAGWGGTTTTAAVAPTTEQRQVEREASDRREVAGGTQPDGETVPHGHLADAYDPWEPRSTATNADYTPQEPAITDADAEEDSVPFYCPHSPYPVDCRICTDPDTLPPFFDSLVRSFVARGFREQHARELTKVLRVLRRWDEMERARVEAEHEARRDRRKRRRRRDQGGGVLPERTDIYGTGTRDDDDDVPTVQALDFRAEWVVQAIIEQTRRTRSSAWSGAELRHLAEAELDISMAAGAGAGSSGVVGAVEADADVPDGLVDTAAPSPIGLPSTALPNPDRNPDPEADLCKICLAHPTNCVLVPCGHYALCIACARRMKVEDGACPVCRQGVAMVVQTFKA